MTISAELREAARLICRETGLDPDAVASSAYAAPRVWEKFIPHARAAGVPFATSLTLLAEVARAAAAVSDDPMEAERLRGRADALFEAANLLSEGRLGGTVVEFRRK